MTAHLSHRLALVPLAALACALGLSACATTGDTTHVAQTPPPVLPTEQYALQAQTMTKSINLRINPNGLSDNQRRALDQVADKASWITGDPVNVEIVTSADPGAVAAGAYVGSYLTGHDVSSENLSQVSAQQQPADIITINMVYYRARTYDCNQTWENLAKTAQNQPYANFGCAVTSNLAAQIADPRDLDQPQTATSGDAGRKSVVLDHYRKGEKTSAEVDDGSSGNISDAIK